MTDPTEEKTAIATDVISRIAEVAHIVGWQAGEPGMEIAGGIVSFLAKHPEHVARFLRDGGEMMIDGTIKGEEGGLTWRTADGRIMSPEAYAAARATQPEGSK